MEQNRVQISTRELTKSFGGTKAVNSVSLEVERSTCMGIIGPNGSGKTTFLNLISGVLKADTGEVHYGGKNITGLPQHKRALLGMGRSFQHANLFPNLPVLENVRLAVQARRGSDWQMFSSHKKDAGSFDKANEAISRVGLTAKSAMPAFSLTHGEKRKLEIAMLWSQDPQVLLLDEPTAGMSVEEVPAVLQILSGIRKERDKTIILVEHRMDLVCTFVDKIAVLLSGQLIACDVPDKIMADKRVLSAYLGEEV